VLGPTCTTPRLVGGGSGNATLVCPGSDQIRTGDRGFDQDLAVPVEHPHRDGGFETAARPGDQQWVADQVVGSWLVQTKTP
jgi:hypothetical protein